MNVDSTSSGQRPRSNGLNRVAANRVAKWLSSQADEHAELSMDQQKPDSTMMEDNDPFIDRVFFGVDFTFTGPTLKRKTSYHGHRDEDPGTPEPSRGAMRRDMKALLTGKYSMPPPRKRIKLPPTSQQNSPRQVPGPETPVIDLEADPEPPTPTPAPLPVRQRIRALSRPPATPETLVPTAPIIAPIKAPASLRPPTLTSAVPTLTLAPIVSVSVQPALATTSMGISETPVDEPESPVSSDPPPTPTRARKGRSRQLRAPPKRTPRAKPKLSLVVEEAEAPKVIPEIDQEAVAVSQDSSFLKLPVEVRNRIYRCLLVSKKPIHVQKLWSQKARANTRRSPRKRGVAPEKLFETQAEELIDTRVLRICRQTHLEGARILYGENRFLYMLRDPKAVDAALGFSNFRVGPASSSAGIAEINFGKYCHLFRHMAVELEPNRTDSEYETLLWRALEHLAHVDSASSPTTLSRANPSASRIFLDSLTITITPVRQTGRQKKKVPKAMNFFQKTSQALKVLQRINTRSILFNVHVERPRQDDEESDDDSDDEENDEMDIDNPLVRSEGANNRRHLETTIDLRFCARYMDRSAMTYIKNPYYTKNNSGDGSYGENVPELIAVYPDELWENDHHVLAKRAMLGQRAEAALADLYKRLKYAWEDADKAVLEGLWEDHAVAEQRRRINRWRYENRFECDALLFRKTKSDKKKNGKGKEVARDDENESDEESCSTDTDTDDDDDDGDSEGDESTKSDGGQPRTPVKSLIITISNIGLGDGEMRAFRSI